MARWEAGIPMTKAGEWRRPGERIKTDRGDALNSAGLARAGELRQAQDRD